MKAGLGGLWVSFSLGWSGVHPADYLSGIRWVQRSSMQILVVQEQAQPIVDSFADTMMEAYTGRMARKMGLSKYDRDLAVGLVTIMYEDKADFTNTFRALASVSDSDDPGSIPAPLEEVTSQHI
jgi:uncharacterized protein YdiU (UPF0061 family)